MKRMVFKLGLHDEKGKTKVMKSVTSISGIDTIALDMKDKTLTVVGDVDPVKVVSKLRKSVCHTEVISVGPPAKEDKKTETKKSDDDGKKKDDQDKKKDRDDQAAELVRAYRAYNPYMAQYYHVVC